MYEFDNSKFLIMKNLQICIIFITTIVASSLSLRIDKCRIDAQIPIRSFITTDSFISGYIDAELNDAEVNGAIFVKNITFTGELHTTEEDFFMDISTRFDPMIKEVRVQRIIDYGNEGHVDVARTKCNLAFINSYDSRMGAKYSVEQAIIRHSETCFRKLLCNFDPERHRIGDDLIVLAKSRDDPWHTTSQKTVNSIIDLAVRTLVNGLVAANLSIFKIPDYSGLILDQYLNKLWLKFEGGLVDVLPYIQRSEDFSIGHEGKRFVIGTAARLTGGTILLNNFTFTHKTAFLPSIDYPGTLPIKSEGISLRAKISFDYNQSPCRMNLVYFDVKIPEENVNFAESLGSVVEDFLTTFKLKSNIIDTLIGLAVKPLRNLIEKLECEALRFTLFRANPSTTTSSP